MNTVNKLQAHLNTPIKSIDGGYTYKEQAKLVTCSDGVTLSVQASEMHYSSPRSNSGPYETVEVWCIKGTNSVNEFDYSEDEPSAYVPIEQVAQFIDNHGGFAN